jgi:hypothetical protein
MGAQGAAYIILVTDGAPNCGDDGGQRRGGGNQMAVADSVDRQGRGLQLRTRASSARPLVRARRGGRQQVSYGDVNGWTLSADKRTLTLQGTACSELADLQGSTVIAD